jgi:uncharacterized repeat protein (TIGR01451 family)
VVYLKNKYGGGAMLEVAENKSGIETPIEDSTQDSSSTSSSTAGKHFGISKNGTIVSYFTFCQQTCSTTFDVGGNSIKDANGIPINLYQYFVPDINDGSMFAFVFNHQVCTALISDPMNSRNCGVGSGDLPRITNPQPHFDSVNNRLVYVPELVYINGAQVVSTFGGVIDGSISNPAISAGVNNLGMIVYEKLDDNGHHQIYLASPYWQQCHLVPSTQRWHSDPYDGDTDPTQTMCVWGCYTTVLARALFIQGISQIPLPNGQDLVLQPNDPGFLNDFMTYYSLYASPDSLVDPDKTTRMLGNELNANGLVPSGNNLTWDDSLSNDLWDPNNPTTASSLKAISDLENAVATHPVIVGVTSRHSDPTRKKFPTHFVLVMGVVSDASGSAYYDGTSWIDFIIGDPAGTPTAATDPPTLNTPDNLPRTLLSQYGKFAIRGSVVDPPDNSGLDFSIGGDATLQVVDSIGRRTGFDPTSGTNLAEIPNSVSFSDSLSDEDIVDEGHVFSPDKPNTSFVHIHHPPSGPYKILVNSAQAGTYTVSVSAYSQDGTVQPPLGIQAPALGSTTTLQYDSAPGSILINSPVTLTPLNLGFANQTVGSTSLSQNVALTNTESTPVSISSIALNGANASDFAQGNNCGSSVAAGASCTITVTFVPTAAGTRTATLTITDSASTSSQPVSLTGSATIPLIFSISPATGSQGRTLANVAITGQYTHFLQGTTTASFGAGITVNSLTVNSPTSATANITIAPSATPGSQTVTLTTGAEVASLLNAFIVTAPVTGLPNLTWLGGGHTGGVNSVSAAPDGTVWSAGGDNTIKQWNAANMNMLRTFPLAQTGGAAFAGNGQQGLVIDSNGAQVVSLADGSVSRTFALGDLGSGAYSPTISANGQTVAFGRSNFAADVLVFANGQGTERDFVASAFDGDGYWFGGVGALAVSADGQYVAASLTADYQTPGTIRLYRVSDGTLLRLLTQNTTNVQALAFSPDGTMLASSSADGKINVLRLSDLVVVSSISVFESGSPVAGTTLAFSPDGTQIALGDSAAAEIYHLPDGASLGRIPGATSSVAFTPDGQWLVVGGAKDVRLWLLATLASLPTVSTHSGSITAVAHSPRGDLVASASTDLTVKLRSAVDGTLVASLTGHTDVVNALAFSPDGDMLATGSSDHTIRIWRTSDFTLLNTLTGHTQAVNALAFSPDGSLLASGSAAPEEVVRLWSVGGTWSNVSTLTGTGGSVTSVQFSPSGQLLAGASSGGIVRLWQVSSGALAQTYLAPTQGGMSLAFSPDGQLLVAGWGQNILVFQGSQTAPVFTVAAHSKSGTVVAYSPDGQRVLSGNPDGTLKLWNPASWSLVTSFNQETDATGAGVTSVAYSADSTRFVYGRADATIGVASTGTTALPASVTVTTNPPGLAITVDGTAYAGPNTFSWTPGSSHSVSAASPQGSNGTRYVFVGWSDGGLPSHSVTPVESRIYTATFITQELLALQTTPTAGGNVVASPTSSDGYYTAGTVVQLTETPAQGYVFSSWSGDASGAASKVTVSMNQPRSVTATFSSVASADIAVSMSSSVTQVNSGKPLAFAITVTNIGPSPSGSMTLIVNLPAAYSFVSASSSRGSCTGTVQISCPLGIIQVTDLVTATVNVTPIATGSISMTASVNGGTADPNPSNNSATVAVNVLPAGLPPILWMGGSPYLGGNNPKAIQTTNDGTIWVLGPHEVVQWRASDLRLLHTVAPDIASGVAYPFAVTPDGSRFAYSQLLKLGVYGPDGSSVASFPYNYYYFGSPQSPGDILLSDNDQKVSFGDVFLAT